jgi:ubiquinone/menaquinone biosynthesis C-methylase UbiE
VIITRVRRSVLSRLFEFMYSAGRWLYDPLTAAFFGPAWHNWRRTVLPWVGSGPVLEIACGTGQLLQELAKRSTFVVGFDQSLPMLTPAARRSDWNTIHVVNADACSIPFEDRSFQTVVSTFPASFVTRHDVLNEVARVLKPGGHFVVVVSARFTRFQWKRPFIHPVLRAAYGSSKSMNRWPQDLLHHPLLPGEWQDLRTPEGEAFVWIATRTANN